MGKKSRVKREKREARSGVPLINVQSFRREQSAHDKQFHLELADLESHFIQFSAYEVILAIGVSDLWLPNRSSQVKHTLAMLIALSIPLQKYQAQRSISTYTEFLDFLNGLKQLLPRFPMLEDFVPEADWGEVRVAGATGFERIFYGGSVERIPDYIQAFKLLKTEHPMAILDMNLAIALQAHILASIDSAAAGQYDDVAAGHIEAPTEAFWQLCCTALLSTYTAIESNTIGTSKNLVIELGTLKPPESFEDFCEAIMMGTALPLLLVRVNGTHLPITPRAASSVVIDLWHQNASSLRLEELNKLSAHLGEFLSTRLREYDLVVGPCNPIGKSYRFDRQITAVICSAKKLYFVLPINLDDIPKLGEIERELNSLVDNSARWGLELPMQQQILELKNGKGETPRSSDIQLLAVIGQVSTQPAFFGLEDIQSRLIGLPDFVSLFDSIDSCEELNKFFAYLDDIECSTGGVLGLIDHFAAFRDSHGVLVEGAISPDWISLDPHWNSSWRFRELMAFWSAAPYRFPDGSPTWVLDNRQGNLVRMRAKGAICVAWSGEIGPCLLQPVMYIEPDPDYTNGPLLELFVHCIADACTQRSHLLEKLELFHRQQIVIQCEMDPRTLPIRNDKKGTEFRALQPLLTNLMLTSASPETTVFSIQVNLSRLASRLNGSVDASFEVECAIELSTGLSKLLGLNCDDSILESLSNTANGPPRFTLRSGPRPFDVPEHTNPYIPEANQFKLARKELAVAFKQQGVVVPARYELEAAKHIMNSARDSARSELHSKISCFDRNQLLKICINQHDQLTAKYQFAVMSLKLSLSHEVSFNRSSRLAEAYEKYISMARNYRYLLEYRASSPGQGNINPTIEEVVQLIAQIDWLSVLYGASDTLHNGIDVGGIEFNSSFVPTVFFSENHDSKDQEYLQDMADAKLGVGLIEGDEVNSDNNIDWQLLDQSFSFDLGFPLTNMIQTLHILAHWHSCGGDNELRFCYQASPAAIAKQIREQLPDIPKGVPEKIISFLTLDSAGIRRLIGGSEDESDVPIWEHSKRAHRYTIRPMIKIDDDVLAWGAATAERALSIWTGTIANGYLPADFNWPTIAKVVRDIKKGIEKLLEVRTYEVFLRHSKFVMHGIDFRRRFPKEKFDDVGDFDVLAYWPDKNLWIAVECKYNQPAFCLKDMRRLRDRIFGQNESRGQFSKIERRLQFLENNVNRLRELLQWPEGQSGVTVEFRNFYICRDISWWLKHPPYEVHTNFIRIDGLDCWLGTTLKQ
jgi:hypothetical protein